MSLRIMTDDMGREVALDPERIEMIRKVIDTLPDPTLARTYCWQVYMRCGSTSCFNMRIQDETMLQFTHRIKHGA